LFTQYLQFSRPNFPTKIALSPKLNPTILKFTICSQDFLSFFHQISTNKHITPLRVTLRNANNLSINRSNGLCHLQKNPLSAKGKVHNSAVVELTGGDGEI
jgi:hypothetical protein